MAPPEKAQEVQMHGGAQSIYDSDALNFNDSYPRHRQRKTIEGTELLREKKLYTTAVFQLVQ
jgi:hypothetical protein